MNIQKDIHQTDYKAQFAGRRLEASSLMMTGERERISLDGRWNFTADALEYTLRSHWYRESSFNADGTPRPADYDFDASPEIDVPACWNMEMPELMHYDGMGVYTRSFSYEGNGERVFLYFEGASYRAYVFLNGIYLGLHDGASTPFSAEVTEHIRHDNRLIVAVDASRSDDRVPMTNTDWYNYGGLYRSVSLIKVPALFIRSWDVHLVPGSGFSRIAFAAEIDGGEADVFFSVPELGLEADCRSHEGSCRLQAEASPELWSPENPKLYDVIIRAGDDVVHDRIGFREIRREGSRLLLNGKERFLRGICLHEDDDVSGKTTDDEAIRSAIRLIKEELHGNFIRLTHYPHTARFARIADEMGILLWEEIPVYWALKFSDEAVYHDAENQLRELIARDINRSSVIIWSVGNENPDTDERLSFMKRLVQAAHDADPSRPVSAACLIDDDAEVINDRLADYLDVIGINEYYGWYSFTADKLLRVLANSRDDKPVILTETGASALAGHHGGADELWTEEKQEDYYIRQTDAFRQSGRLSGTAPWILYDFRSERRMNGFQRGYNRKGLIDSDKKTKKAAFHVLAAFYKEKSE